MALSASTKQSRELGLRGSGDEIRDSGDQSVSPPEGELMDV
jgi:hypothetical protein